MEKNYLEISIKGKEEQLFKISVLFVLDFVAQFGTVKGKNWLQVDLQVPFKAQVQQDVCNLLCCSRVAETGLQNQQDTLEEEQNSVNKYCTLC